MALFVMVEARAAEEVRRKLLEEGVLDPDIKPEKEGGYVLFPVLRPVEGYVHVEREGQKFRRRGSYRDYVNVPAEIIPLLPSSFDIVGDIGIVRIPEEVMDYAEEIGRGIAIAHRNVRLVAADMGVEGVERVRRLVPIYGTGRFETVHREYGVRIRLDISKVYFSPRLATERWRVAEQVRDGETVVDMFAGVGPFSLLIASRRRVTVHAIDINPVAIDYLRRNIRGNRLVGRIVPHLGDAREIAPRLGKCDRVIMNLPHSAYTFGDVVAKISRKGTVIHLHCIGDGRERGRMLRTFIGDLREGGVEPRVKFARKVRDYSPGREHFVYDIIST